MNLEEQLAAVREGAAKRIPPDRQAVMHKATEQLRNSGILDRRDQARYPRAGLHAR